MSFNIPLNGIKKVFYTLETEAKIGLMQETSPIQDMADQFDEFLNFNNPSVAVRDDLPLPKLVPS